jgi:hypothetical protein
VLDKIVAIEGNMAVDTDKGGRPASTEGMLLGLFLLQSCIAVAAHEGYHIVEKVLLLKGNFCAKY